MAGSIVTIGCSWGGLRALTAIVAALPEDLPAAVVVVQHRAPDAASDGLGDILSRHAALPVRTVEDKDEIGPGLFVAPPDYHLLVEPDGFALSIEERINHSRPSIDVLFDSAAAAFGADVTGVVLTGANGDGAAGLRTIRRRGGWAVVQDPAQAERDTMPRAAIELAGADEILPLEQIAPAIVRRCARERPRAAVR
jgi:two-component system chemotaxis response regulator CheB